MFSTTLWATDGSEAAASALPVALDLVRESGGTLIVAHVRELLGGRSGGYPVYPDDPEIQQRLQDEAQELRATGIDVRFEVRTCANGQIARTLVQLADEADADLIVVGTHGHTKVGQLLLGSVTQELLRLRAYPVLAMPSTGTETTGTTADAAGRAARS